jgi:hydroxypyruvate reductase
MRGEAEGLDIEDSLARADSNPFLAASCDLIHLGATGTNVMDLMLAWKA